MPFTNPPKYDQDRETWPDFVGETVIVEPIKKHTNVPTRYGAQDCYESIVWVLRGNSLEPHAGVRIFNQRIVSQLEVAHRMSSPIPGVVAKDGNSVRLTDATPEITEYLSQLWDGSSSDGASQG